MIDRSNRLSRSRPDVVASGDVHLSPRQLACARLAADGLQSKEIARRLGLSHYTVQQYLAAAFVRLSVHNRTQLAVAMVRQGLIAS